MMKCRICKKPDCDDDCEEIASIYREQQREKLRDIDPEEIECDVCGRTYGEAYHDDCIDGGCYDAQFSC